MTDPPLYFRAMTKIRTAKVPRRETGYWWRWTTLREALRIKGDPLSWRNWEFKRILKNSSVPRKKLKPAPERRSESRSSVTSFRAANVFIWVPSYWRTWEVSSVYSVVNPLLCFPSRPSAWNLPTSPRRYVAMSPSHYVIPCRPWFNS